MPALSIKKADIDQPGELPLESFEKAMKINTPFNEYLRPLQQNTQKSDIEWCSMISPDGRIVNVNSGGRYEVPPSVVAAEAGAITGDRGAVSMHTHPRGGSFSPGDIAYLLSHKEIGSIVVSESDHVWQMQKTAETKDISSYRSKMILEKITAVFDQTKKKRYKQAKDDGAPEWDAFKFGIITANEAVAKKYNLSFQADDKITWDRPLSVSKTMSTEARFKDLYKSQESLSKIRQSRFKHTLELSNNMTEQNNLPEVKTPDLPAIRKKLVNREDTLYDLLDDEDTAASLLVQKCKAEMDKIGTIKVTKPQISVKAAKATKLDNEITAATKISKDVRKPPKSKVSKAKLSAILEDARNDYESLINSFHAAPMELPDLQFHSAMVASDLQTARNYGASAKLINALHSDHKNTLKKIKKMQLPELTGTEDTEYRNLLQMKANTIDEIAKENESYAAMEFEAAKSPKAVKHHEVALKDLHNKYDDVIGMIAGKALKNGINPFGAVECKVSPVTKAGLESIQNKHPVIKQILNGSKGLTGLDYTGQLAQIDDALNDFNLPWADLSDTEIYLRSRMEDLNSNAAIRNAILLKTRQSQSTKKNQLGVASAKVEQLTEEQYIEENKGMAALLPEQRTEAIKLNRKIDTGLEAVEHLAKVQDEIKAYENNLELLQNELTTIRKTGKYEPWRISKKAAEITELKFGLKKWQAESIVATKTLSATNIGNALQKRLKISGMLPITVERRLVPELSNTLVELKTQQTKFTKDVSAAKGNAGKLKRANSALKPVQSKIDAVNTYLDIADPKKIDYGKISEDAPILVKDKLAKKYDVARTKVDKSIKLRSKLGTTLEKAETKLRQAFESGKDPKVALKAYEKAVIKYKIADSDIVSQRLLAEDYGTQLKEMTDITKVSDKSKFHIEEFDYSKRQYKHECPLNKLSKDDRSAAEEDLELSILDHFIKNNPDILPAGFEKLPADRQRALASYTSLIPKNSIDTTKFLKDIEKQTFFESHGDYTEEYAYGTFRKALSKNLTDDFILVADLDRDMIVRCMLTPDSVRRHRPEEFAKFVGNTKLDPDKFRREQLSILNEKSYNKDYKAMHYAYPAELKSITAPYETPEAGALDEDDQMQGLDNGVFARLLRKDDEPFAVDANFGDRGLAIEIDPKWLMKNRVSDLHGKDKAHHDSSKDFSKSNRQSALLTKDTVDKILDDPDNEIYITDSVPITKETIQRIFIDPNSTVWDDPTVDATTEINNLRKFYEDRGIKVAVAPKRCGKSKPEKVSVQPRSKAKAEWSNVFVYVQNKGTLRGPANVQVEDNNLIIAFRDPSVKNDQQFAITGTKSRKVFNAGKFGYMAIVDWRQTFPSLQLIDRPTLRNTGERLIEQVIK